MNGQGLIWQSWKLPSKNDTNLHLWEKILCNRGLDTPSKRHAFLEADPLDPFSFADMERAVMLLYDVLEKKGRIIVFGDYDADGLTATAIIVRLIRRLDGDVSWLIPDRLDEGYGIGDGHVKSLLTQGPALLITVDCGSNSKAEIASLKAAGIKVIVTDHHLVDQQLDVADAHINPREDQAVSDLLSGAGVAYFLAEAYLLTFGDHHDQDLLAMFRVLATVGTIADIMPLTGANRALVKEGLADFRDFAPPGLLQLVQDTSVPDATTIAFSVGPALNAASRLGEADTALHTLLTDDELEAGALVERLHILNDRRRALEAEITKAAFLQVKSKPTNDRVIVVSGEAWHSGVLGIVAAKLVDQFGKPAIVLNRDGKEWQGSARSIVGVDIHALLADTADLLVRYGGHQRAAGLAFLDEDYGDFVSALQRHAAALPPVWPWQAVDVVVSGDDLTKSELEGVGMLEPFGEGNPQPLGLAAGCRIVSIRTLSQAKHAKLEVDFQGDLLTAVMFRRGDLVDYYGPGDVVDLVGKPLWHTYRNRSYAQLLLTDIRPSPCGDLAFDNPLSPHVTIDDLAACPLDPPMFKQAYGMLLELAAYEELVISPVLFAKRLSRAYNKNYSGLALVNVFTILAEAGMVRWRRHEDASHLYVQLIENPTRAALRETPTWQTLTAKGWLMP